MCRFELYAMFAFHSFNELVQLNNLVSIGVSLVSHGLEITNRVAEVYKFAFTLILGFLNLNFMLLAHLNDDSLM